MNKRIHAQIKIHETKQSVGPVIQFSNSQSATWKQSQYITVSLMYCLLTHQHKKFILHNSSYMLQSFMSIMRGHHEYVITGGML